jgi:hypothetical protein
MQSYVQTRTPYTLDSAWVSLFNTPLHICYVTIILKIMTTFGKLFVVSTNQTDAYSSTECDSVLRITQIETRFVNKLSVG